MQTQLVANAEEARKDAVRLAEQAQTTLDRIVMARYDRPERTPRPEAKRSLMDTESLMSQEDDAEWLKTQGEVQ